MMDQKRRQSDGPGGTERWVKWTVGILLPILAFLVGKIFDLSTNVAVLMNYKDDTNRARMERDSSISDSLKMLVQQHMEFMAAFQRQTDRDNERVNNRRNSDPPLPGFQYPK